MLDYSPTKTQKLLGNPDKSDNPTASSPACAGLAGEHCTVSLHGNSILREFDCDRIFDSHLP